MTDTLYFCSYDTNLVGKLFIVTNGKEIINIEMTLEDWEKYAEKHHIIEDQQSSFSKNIIQQFDEYFNQKRQTFDLPLKVKGTIFQQAVWNTLLTIPYGQTWSYIDVATKIEKPKACRAVGQANRANPIPIIIPCHRVIGKNKALTGYAGTRVDVKEKLLELEGYYDFLANRKI